MILGLNRLLWVIDRDGYVYRLRYGQVEIQKGDAITLELWSNYQHLQYRSGQQIDGLTEQIHKNEELHQLKDMTIKTLKDAIKLNER